jgi:hypothetical protein
VARALRRRNSLRTAIQLWGVARSCYGFRDCTAHPTQKEETSGTAPLSSPSHIPQVHRRNSAHTEQSAETTFLTSPSQFPPISFRGATKCWPCPQTLVFYRRGEFRSDLHARERRHKKDCFSSTASRQQRAKAVRHELVLDEAKQRLRMINSSNNRLVSIKPSVCDPHSRRSWQRDRNARARGRFQRAVSVTRETKSRHAGVA